MMTSWLGPVGPNSVRIAEDLEDLVDVRPSVISALNLHKTLTAAYKSAVDLVKVDHSGLILYHTGYSTGGVCAEFPEDTGTYGIELPLRGLPAQDQLIDGKLPLIVCDTSKASDFGAGQAIFLKFGIRSLVIVPVLGKEQVLISTAIIAERIGNDPLSAVARLKDIPLILLIDRENREGRVGDKRISVRGQKL